MVFTNKIFRLIFLLYLFFSVPGLVFSQTGNSSGNLETMLIITVVLLLLVSIVMIVVVIYTTYVLKLIMDRETQRRTEKEGIPAEPFESFWQQLSRSLTRSTPVVKEETILMDHDYDGIRELDNHLPP